MLENWYFCSALGLPPRAAAEHLDVVAALQEPVEQPSSGELVSAAVDRLAASDTALAIHALPHVLRAHRRCLTEHERFLGEAQDVVEHQRCVCVREVTDRVALLYGGIAEVVPQQLRSEIYSLLLAAGSGEGGTADSLLREVLESKDAPTAWSADPTIPAYHDLLDQLVPTVLLTVSRFLADIRPSAVRTLMEDSSTLLNDALRGRHGRLALLQAAELAAALQPQDTSSVLDDLGRAARGTLDLEPDLLATAARVAFAPTGIGDADQFDRIAAEAMTSARLGSLLARWRRGGIEPDAAEADSRRRLAYTRLGGSGDHRRSSMPSVLWQTALFSLAADVSPERAVALAERCWQAPDGPPRGDRIQIAVPFGKDYEYAQLHAVRLLRLRGTTPDWRMPTVFLEDAPADTTAPAAAARLWSPWILAASGEQRQEPAGPEQLVRLLGAGTLAMRLLSRGAADADGAEGRPDCVLLLLIHIRDVLGNRYRSFMEEISSGSLPGSVPTGHLASLMLHLRAQTDRIGTGQRPAVHPAEIVRVVTRLHVPEPGAPRQAEPLRTLKKYRTAIITALNWLQEAAAGGTRDHRAEASGRWFRYSGTGTAPAARALLDLASEQGGEPYRSAAVQAVLLRREIYPDEPTSTLRWDWVGGRPEFEDRTMPTGLNYRKLLLSGPGDLDRDSFSVREWADMAAELEKYVHDEYGIIPITLRTLRLAALLKEPALGEEGAYTDWVSSWTQIAQAVNMPAHLPRWVRGRMFDMFGAPVAGKESHDRLLHVLEQVVDVVIDLSAGAPFYYDQLFEVLSTETSLSVGSANHLRQRALQSLYHRWGPRGLSTDSGNPFDAYADRVSARGTEARLVCFLRETAHQQLESSATPLAAAMDRLWQRTHKPSRLTAVSEDIGFEPRRLRSVVAAVADRRTGEVLLYGPKVQLGTMRVGRSRKVVRNLFDADAPATVPDTYLLGFICGKDAYGQQPKLWVNCGLPNAVSMDLTHHHRGRRLGEAVAVRIAAGNRSEASEVVPLAPDQPADGEVRSAELTAVDDAFPWLALTVDDVDLDCYPKGDDFRDIAARRRWDPDLSRAFSADGSSGYRLRTLATWHEEYRHWVPLDAGLAELAVAAEPGEEEAAQRSAGTVLRLVVEGPATDRSGYGPAWRFVTSPGRTYVLGPSAWEADDWDRLDEECSKHGAGLIVHAEFPPARSRLRLLEQPSGPFDKRNINWLAVFDTQTAEPRADAEGTVDDDEEDAQQRDLYHEAVRWTGDGAGPSRWTIEVPETEGFPPRVTVEFASQPRRQDRPAPCTIENWGEPEARKAVVSAQPVDEKGISETEPRIDRYDALARLAEDSVVELVGQLSKKPENSDNLVQLSSGMVGLVATESLTLTNKFPKLSPSARRAAVVVRDGHASRPRPNQEPEPLADLARHCPGLEDAGRLDRHGRLSGLVMSRMTEADKTITLLRIWLRLDEEVVEAVVPARSFDHKSPSAGDHLVADHTADGWVFSVLQRSLRLRALWEWADSPADKWSAVGVLADPGATRGRTLFQCPDSARVALGEEPAQSPGPGGQTQAKRLYRDRVLVTKQSGDALMGTASGMVLGAAPQIVRVEQTLLRTGPAPTLPSGYGDKQLTDIVREFVLSPAAASRPQPERNRRTVDPKADWERFLQGPDLTITGPLEEDRLYLGTLRAPDGHGAYQNWLAPADEPQTLIVGRRYLEGRTRAVPVPHGSGYRFSHLRAAPLTVKEFMAEVVPGARVDGSRRPIASDRRPYFVGVEETDAGRVYRFEWGFGWFVDIPDAALTVGGQPVDPSGLTLFHGDRINAMSFSPGTDTEVPGGIRVSIALADITKGVQYQIDQEAEGKVVHLLELELDHASGRVAVLRVHTRSRGIDLDRADEHVAGRAVGAFLHPTDEQRLLAQHGPGRRQQRVLGRLVPDHGPGRGRVRQFRLVPPQPAPDENSPGLHEGDSLYLEAGKIHTTTNDYLLRFGLPDQEEWAQEGDPLEVTVLRREFSHRESVLRRAMDTDGEAAYQNKAKMLVKLLRPRHGKANSWNGSTKSPRSRPLDALRGYLDSRGGTCFGVVDRNGRTIEVRPGVVFPTVGTRMRKDVTPGSVVRLERYGDDGIAVVLAIPADEAYLGAQPRPVVVFPKDDLRTEADLEHADKPGRFTLAGLPGVNATARKNFGAVLLRAAHPKIAAVQIDEQAPKHLSTQVVPLDNAEASTLAFDADDVVRGVRRERLAPAGSEFATAEADVPWAQLSFMDDTARGIAEACRTRGWTYHDTRTRQWVWGHAEPKMRRLPARARATTEPVFFSRNSTGWTLRHDRNALHRFGFPAGELLEEPVDDLASGARRAWAVAWADRRSVWLELAPGRVAEVRGELVRFADGHSLSDLDWSLFSPGDLVYGRVQGGVSECGHLVLDSWRPGVRGSFAAPAVRRMLLPVTHHDEGSGALFLGEGAGTFPFPAERAVLDAHPVGAAVWLERTNTLTPADPGSVSVDDVVFLAPDLEKGGLRVLGLPRVRVRLADETAADNWPGCGWLRIELAQTERKRSALLGALGSVPVTVEGVSLGPEPVLTVSRRAQPRSNWPKGVVLAQPVADLGRGFVAVRSGSALFRLHIKQVVPGLPEEASSAAAAAFAKDTGHVRLYWDANSKMLSCGQRAGLSSGSPGSGVAQEIQVRAWLPVNDDKDRALGVICREESVQRAYWLPAPECAWTTDVHGTTLFDHLHGRRRLTVLRDGPDSVTLRGLPLVERAYQNLAPGQKVQVRLVSVPQEPTGPCLVSMEPLGMLATYAPSDPHLHPVGVSLIAEVATLKHRQGKPTLTLVEPESRLTVTDLPGWMSTALQRLHLANFATGPQPVDKLVPEHFAAYWRSYGEGLEGKFATNQGDALEGMPPAETEESAACRVLRAWGLLNAGAVGSTAETERFATRGLLEWLCSTDGRNTLLQRDAPVDAAPALAACAMGARLATSDSPNAKLSLPAGWVVFLLSRLGQRAIGSLHTEALVTQWLTVPERHLEIGGCWRRLRAVAVAPRLTAEQLDTVVQFGEAMTGPQTAGESKFAAAPVARGLLAAVGRLPSAEALCEDARILRPLAELGAGLQSAAHAAVSQRRLLNGQVSVVNRAVKLVVRDQVPLTLLPMLEPLTDVGRKYAEDVVRAAESQLGRL